jgi:hypothetical protein
VAGGFGLVTKVGLDGLLASGILGGDIQELPRHAWGLVIERKDECLASHAIDEGVDHVDVGEVGELIALLGEALGVHSKGLIGTLPIVAEVP